MAIWFDVTTTLGWGRPALGIVRVEAETAKHFLDSRDPKVRFCRFDIDLKSYFEVECDDIVSVLERLDAGDHLVSAALRISDSEEITAVEPAISVEGRLKKLVQWGIFRLPVRYHGKALQLAQSGRSTFLNLRNRCLKDRRTIGLGETATAHPLRSVEGLSPLTCVLPRGIEQPFDAGDSYISLGLDWDQKDMAFLYALKQKLKLKVLLFCYDIIPILLPQYCVPGVSEKFPEYFAAGAWCADQILCISECSRSDLREYLTAVGAPVPTLDIVRLGSDVPAQAGVPPTLAVAEIGSRRFILFVSTIEVRKNHDILYRAYSRLLDEGHEDLPLLVFVGMEGWGVEKLLAALQSDLRIKSYIRILNHVSDSDLVHLYSKSEFTVYPSLYEGWGLPVAESLAYGKFCLASSAASIPEVGGDLIEYVDPHDEAAWAARLLWYFNNPDDLADRQSEIVQNFNRVSWEQTGAAILTAVESL